MARIRTIKPEFPQSESLGRVSRDARLLFAMLFTVADDAGRLRGASRMLASLLFPYDDDAPRLIDGWLTELEMEGCIRRYEVNGSRYIDIPKWLEHQKIDRPSQSRFPAFDEASRIIAKPREPSSEEGKGREGKGEEGTGEEGNARGATVADAPLPDPDPPQLAFDAWNDLAIDLALPIAQVLTPERKTKLRRRLEECGGLEGWAAALARIRGSPFLLGKNDRRWKADLDFVLQKKSFTRLMEGSYERTDQSLFSNGFAELAASGQLGAFGGDGP